MTTLMTILGLLGAAMITLMYVLLQRGSVNAESLKFYVVNGVGALMILVSLAYDYDSADLGGIAMEACWIVVSLMGVIKVFKKKEEAR